ncbi:enoyl-CoA hydratase [Halobacillus shinanisalinarum]|uniref:Enoyl-CoA hydratase n=1 Tax=Halobacillus shinanisalinarum TaxID=2932258 RepID=A0ABY4H1P1_9BACI|nr:enoyl-CoA hydratase [Halobacillus shinanisalinarum]UOQ94079.1 enoyl-CoA hydratase [Halobacillus shinanisalinarum]
MSTVQFQKENHLARITIQSPPANPLSSTLLHDLAEIMDEIEKDSSIKAILIKGEGKFFSAGADIKEFTSFQDASDYEKLSSEGQELFNRIENFHIPVIAAIHGAALGGGLELAMSCHIRYVAEDAKLGLPELNLGIIPGFAGTQRLPRYVGTPKAYEMILTGVPINGEEAVAAGLANKSLPVDELFEAAEKLALQVAARSGPTIHQVMKLVPYAHTSQFPEGGKAEARAFGEVFGNDDAKEGIKAFMEKRKPAFKDQ